MTARPSKQGRKVKDQPSGRFRLQEEDTEGQELVRADSWAEELEKTIRNKGMTSEKDEDDRNQWAGGKRLPSEWANGLTGQVREAADKSGRRRHKEEGKGMEGGRLAAERMDGVHKCRKSKTEKVHHWFGESASEESSSESDTGSSEYDENEENWSKIERNKKKYERRKRSRDRKEKKMAEVASKARRMAGVGPITDHEIDLQRKKTKNYEMAKVWAVKSHLADKYEYNQEELDELVILETKRTNKDNIVYIAVEEERDIRDIYYRKAECQRDETVVKHYIPPPQYWERFSALNKICAQRREEDR